MTTYAPAVDRFWLNVPSSRKPHACWNWQGATSNGYGIINVHGRKTYAHRLTLEIHKRRIRHAYVVDHLCSNRRCVNPAHLEVVSFSENVKRGVRSTVRLRRIEKGLYVP